MYPCNKVEKKRGKGKEWGEDRRKRSRATKVGVSRKGETKKRKKKSKNDKDITVNNFVMFIKHYKQDNSTEILSQKKKV